MKLSNIQWVCIGFTISALFYSIDAIVYWTEATTYEDNIHLITYLGGSMFYLIACIAWINQEFPLLFPNIISCIVMKKKSNDTDNNDGNSNGNTIQMNSNNHHNQV